jgi:hypothetical protein
MPSGVLLSAGVQIPPRTRDDHVLTCGFAGGGSQASRVFACQKTWGFNSVPAAARDQCAALPVRKGILA